MTWQAVAFTVQSLILTVAAVWAGWQLYARRYAIRRRVLVNLLSGSAVDGVLWMRRGGILVLREARLIESGAEPAPMDGEVLIDRARVDFIQAAWPD